MKVIYTVDQLQNINNRKPLKEEFITENEMYVFSNRVKQYKEHQKSLSYFLADFPRKWNWRNGQVTLKNVNIFDWSNGTIEAVLLWNDKKERAQPEEELYLCDDIGYSGFYPVEWNAHISR